MVEFKMVWLFDLVQHSKNPGTINFSAFVQLSFVAKP